MMHIPSKLWKCTTVSLWHWAVLPSFLLTFHETPSVDRRSYCWWKKSCTSWYGDYPIIYKVLYIQLVVVWDFWSINSTCLETLQPLTNLALFLAVKLYSLSVNDEGKNSRLMYFCRITTAKIEISKSSWFPLKIMRFWKPRNPTTDNHLFQLTPAGVIFESGPQRVRGSGENAPLKVWIRSQTRGRVRLQLWNTMAWLEGYRSAGTEGWKKIGGSSNDEWISQMLYGNINYVKAINSIPMYPRHPVILSDNDWGVQSPSQKSI